MINSFRKMSMAPKGLKYKTMIAFCLMSLIPLLICFWLVITYIFPHINLFSGLSIGNISFILVVSLFISLLGFYLTREMIDPVVKIADDARTMAEGGMDKMIDVAREDEIGDLGKSLNIMTQKIKENIEELKAYSERTKLINIEINKKVLALSGLLQIGNLMSSAADLKTVLDFISQKLSDIEDGSVSFIFMLDEESGNLKPFASHNVEEARVKEILLRQEEVGQKILIVDKDNPPMPDFAKKILGALDLKNILLMPIVVYKKLYGAVAVGNKKDDFAFREDEKELLKVFLKQTSIAVENDLLIKRAKELAIKDELTGLYNESYIKTRLDEEIKRACIYQRPCGYLAVDVDNFKNFRDNFGETRAEGLLRAMGELLKGSVTEVDRVARISTDEFAIVLPEKNKKQVASIAEEIRKKVEAGLKKVMNVSEAITVSIGVSENPIDGSIADELMDKAEKLVRQAKSLGKNRVAV